MFKRLKDKLAEEVRQSPIKSTVESLGQSIQQQFGAQEENVNKATVSTSKKSGAQDLISLGDNTNNVSVNPSALTAHPDLSQFSIDESDDASAAGDTPVKNIANNVGLPKPDHSSTPSKDDSMNDAALLPMYTSPTATLNLQSDLESTQSEMEDSFHLKNPHASVDVDRLVYAFEKVKNRFLKYKGKYSEAVKAYRDLHNENGKIKQVLSESQDKALRRISELREQCQLEQKAKAHLEENLQVSLEEKDQLISVLQTQVRLLKNGESLESLNDSAVLVDITEAAPKQEDYDELITLKDKVKRLETLLTKCKDTIKNHKERNQGLSVDKDTISKELDEKIREFNSYKESSAENIKELRLELDGTKERLNRLLKQEEDGALTMAEAKRQMYEELMGKETVIKGLKSKENTLLVERENWGRTEKALEEEKQSLIQELSRGKAAAIILLKQEEEKKLLAQKIEYEQKIEEINAENNKKLIEKDESLVDKMEAFKQDMNAELEEKKEKMKTELREEQKKMQADLDERKNDMALAIEERDLQKMAALSQQDQKSDQLRVEIENLNTHELELVSTIEALKISLNDERQDWMRQIEENRERRIGDWNALIEKHRDEVDSLKLQLNDEMNDKIERIRIIHGEQVEDMTKNYEESLLNACSDLEKSLLDRISNEKMEHHKSFEDNTEKIKNLESVNEERNKSLDSMRSEVDEKEEVNSKLIVKLGEVEERYSKLLGTEEALKLKVEELKSELKKSAYAFDEMSGEKAAVEERAQSAQKLGQELQKKLDCLENEYSQMKNEHEQLKSEVESMKGFLEVQNKVSDDADSMRSEFENFKKKFMETQVENDECTKRLNADLMERNEKISNLVEEKESFRLKSEELTDRLDHETEHSRRLGDELMQLQSKLSEVNTQLDENIINYEDTIAEKNRRIGEIETHRDSLGLLLGSSKKSIVELQGDLREIKNRIGADVKELGNFTSDKVESIESLFDRFSEYLSLHELEKTSKLEKEVQNSEIYAEQCQDLKERCGKAEESMRKMEQEHDSAISALKTDCDNQIRAHNVLSEKLADYETINLNSTQEMKSKDDLIRELEVKVSDLSSSLEEVNRLWNDALEEKCKLKIEHNEDMLVKNKEFEQKESGMQQTIEQLENRMEVLNELQTKLEKSEKVTEESDKVHRENIANVEAHLKEQRQQLIRDHEKLIEERDAKICDLEEQFRSNMDQIQLGNSDVVSTLESKCGCLEDKIKLNEELRSVLERQKYEMVEKIEELEQYVKDSNAKISELKDDVEKLKAENEQMEEKLSVNVEVMAQLRTSNVELVGFKDHCAISDEKIKGLEDMVKTLGIEKEHIEVQMNDDSEVSARLESSSLELSSFKEQLKVSKEKINELEDLMKTLRMEKEQIEVQMNEVSEVRARLEASSVELDSFREQLKGSEAKINELEEVVKTLRMEKEQIEVQMNEDSEIRARLESSGVELGSFKEQFDISEEKINELETEVESLKMEKEEGLKSYLDVNNQLESCNVQLVSLKEELEIAMEKVKTMANEKEENVKVVEAQLESSNTELASVRDQLEVLEEKLKTSEDRAEKINKDGQNKLLELRKRAEAKLGKIKKQVESEKQKEIKKIQSEMSIKEENFKSEVEKLGSKVREVSDDAQEQMESLRNEMKVVSEKLTCSEERELELEKDVKIITDQKSKLEKDMKNLKEAHMLAYGSTALDDQHKAELEAIELDHRVKIDQLEVEHQKKLKMIMKEFTQRIEKKDEEYEVMLNQAIVKGTKDENLMVREHEEQIKDLTKDLDEKIRAIEEVREYYHGIINDKESQWKECIDNLNSKIEKLENDKSSIEVQKNNEIEKMSEKLGLLEKEKTMLITDHMEELAEVEFKFQQDLKRELEDQKIAFKDKISKMNQAQQRENGGNTLHPVDDCGALGESKTLEKQSRLTMSVLESGTESAELLRKQIISQSQEIEDLKFKYVNEVKELREEMEQLKNRGHDNLNNSLVKDNTSKNNYRNYNSDSSKTDFTEKEYLKNVLFEYLMGKETMTMIKVISAVLKFSEEQTKKIIEKEEARQSLVSQFIGT